MIAKPCRGERAFSDKAYEENALQAGQLWFGGRSNQSRARCCKYRTVQVSSFTCHSGKGTLWDRPSTAFSNGTLKDITTLSKIQ